MTFMKNPKNTQNMDETFNAALNAAFEREEAEDEVLSALASMSDEELVEMRQTISAAQNRLQALAKSKTAK
jgi:hypothetical protein